MLTLKECITYCDLTEAEVEAIAEHENLPPLVATLVGCHLLQSHNGHEYIRQLLQNRAEEAHRAGDADVAAHRHQVYQEFVQRIPAIQVE